MGMKQILFSLIFLLLLAACQSPEPPADDTTAVQIQKLNGDYPPGTPRVSFALFDGPDPFTGVERVEVSTQRVDGDNTDIRQTLTAVAYPDYLLPYWVIYPELTEEGIWGLTATIYHEDGRQLQAQFLAQVQAGSTAVAIGDTAPRSQNRTLATEPDINKLSSGIDPDPALYQTTIADAIETGKPTVVAFATPGFCATAWCTPVLDSVSDVFAANSDQANFIHVEIYQDFEALTLAPTVTEWGLVTEPWVYVLDGDGRVAARFEGPLAPQELSAALAPLLP